MEPQNWLVTLFDELAIPHRSPIRELRTRFGVTQSKYYSWDIVEARDAGRLSPDHWRAKAPPRARARLLFEHRALLTGNGSGKITGNRYPDFVFNALI
jgi:hypothetical protein